MTEGAMVERREVKTERIGTEPSWRRKRKGEGWRVSRWRRWRRKRVIKSTPSVDFFDDSDVRSSPAPVGFVVREEEGERNCFELDRLPLDVLALVAIVLVRRRDEFSEAHHGSDTDDGDDSGDEVDVGGVVADGPSDEGDYVRGKEGRGAFDLVRSRGSETGLYSGSDGTRGNAGKSRRSACTQCVLSPLRCPRPSPSLAASPTGILASTRTGRM